VKVIGSILLITAALIQFKKQKSNDRYSPKGQKVSSIQNQVSGNQYPASGIRHPASYINQHDFIIGLKKLSLVLFAFIGYLALTLTYSLNPQYGFQKIINFIISIVPSIFVFYYLISTLSEQRINLLIYSIALISVVTVVYILIVYPFDQTTMYEFRPGRWSHVIYGRMISSFAIVLLLYLAFLKKKAQIIFYSFICAVAVYETYLSALRSAILGLIIIIGLMLVQNQLANRNPSISFFENLQTKSEAQKGLSYLYNRKMHLAGLLLTVLITLVFIVFIPSRNIIETRLENMVSVEKLEFDGDPAIHSRLDAWELSLKIIKENPVLGIGLGGFNGYVGLEWTKYIKYSHNLFLEMTVEGGVIGLLVLCSLFVVIFRSIYRFWSRFLLLTFFIFALFLAMFSKDISTQPLIWMFLVFIIKRDNNDFLTAKN